MDKLPTPQSLDDVRFIADYLINRLHITFHPDTDFEDYVNIDSGKVSFSHDEAKSLNDLLMQCREICLKYGASIYDVMDVQPLVPSCNG